MADLTKIKRRNTLGAPPAPEEASQNLNAPETAPVMPMPVPLPESATGSDIPLPQPSAPTRIADDRVRIDARSLRKTGRTLQLATRVSWEFDDKLRRIAQRDGLLLVEVLERALDAYERQANQ
jgi:hypothetical protein